MRGSSAFLCPRPRLTPAPICRGSVRPCLWITDAWGTSWPAGQYCCPLRETNAAPRRRKCLTRHLTHCPAAWTILRPSHTQRRRDRGRTSLPGDTRPRPPPPRTFFPRWAPFPPAGRPSCHRLPHRTPLLSRHPVTSVPENTPRSQHISTKNKPSLRALLSTTAATNHRWLLTATRIRMK